MTDIVERLRQYAENDMRVEDVCLKAANEIERLRSALEAAEQALRDYGAEDK